MFTCPICKTDHTDGVKCSKCVQLFCFSCANISEVNYRKLGPARQAAVQCAACKGKLALVSTSSPSVSGGASSPATLDIVLQELRNGINGINVRLEQLPSLVHEIHEVSEKLRNFELSLDSTKKEVANNSVSIGIVSKRVEILEKQPSVAADYPQLKSELANLTSELAKKDQLLRLNNSEIKGIPYKKNENLFDIISKIGTAIGHPIEKTDINFITRARSSSQPKPIIIGFLGRYSKENFVAAARSHKPGLTAGTLGFEGVSARIYVNDHLTKDNKQLLTKTKKMALDKDHKYVWVQSCKILTRKNDTSPIIVVSSEEDFSKIK